MPARTSLACVQERVGKGGGEGGGVEWRGGVEGRKGGVEGRKGGRGKWGIRKTTPTYLARSCGERGVRVAGKGQAGWMDGYLGGIGDDGGGG